MNHDEDPSHQLVVLPQIIYAPLGELKVYHITEDELDQLAQGSPAELLLNFALSCISVCVSLVASLFLTTIESPMLFAAFVAITTTTLIAGLVLLALWWKAHRQLSRLADKIRARMPKPSVQETE